MRSSGSSCCLDLVGLFSAALLSAAPACKPQARVSTPEPIEAAAEGRSDARDRVRVALTVYNSNFALVREERVVRVGAGRVALVYEDVTAHIQPESVLLRALEPSDALTVLEQNYRYDLLTPEKLLEKYVGRSIGVARYDAKLGREEVRQAEVLASQNGPVLRIDGEVTHLGGRFIFPEVPENLLPKPTLVWLLDSRADRQDIEVSYLTQNLSWRADYVLVLAADEAHADLTGWVTLDNQSGTSFTGAELKLVAGDVERVVPAPPPQPPMPTMLEDSEADAPQQFQREALFEYHLYALSRKTDLLDREQKQISLLEAQGITVEKKLISIAPGGGFRSRFGPPQTKEKVSVSLEIKNRREHGLGMPLPAGILRVYKADSAGSQQFVGEDALEHTPEDETVKVKLGQAFDVLTDRRQTSWQAQGKCGSESAWEIAVHNHKDAAARVEVLEFVDGDWTVTASSLPAERRDARSFAFDVSVPARGEVKLTYRVRVRWC
jgi:hypothetical protein